ncbi:MAG: hypothetical protein LAT54_03715 [Cryomorphaceae bacterium]|nr:hypothetical protein [Cryomorphaceae bacterium]
MKKALLFIAVGLSIMGCRREGPEGPPGAPASFTILDITVQPQDWSPFGEFQEPDYQWTAGFNAPEISQRVFNDALVIGYLIDNGVAYILPNTINFDGFIREFSMIHAVDVVEFIVKDSDLESGPPEGPIDYRVYIIDAQARVDGMEDWELEEMEQYVDMMNEEE